MLLTYIVTFTITYNEATRDVVIVSLKVRNSCCSNNIIINFYIIHNDYYTSDIIKQYGDPGLHWTGLHDLILAIARVVAIAFVG